MKRVHAYRSAGRARRLPQLDPCTQRRLETLAAMRPSAQQIVPTETGTADDLLFIRAAQGREFHECADEAGCGSEFGHGAGTVPNPNRDIPELPKTDPTIIPVAPGLYEPSQDPEPPSLLCLTPGSVGARLHRWGNLKQRCPLEAFMQG